MTLKDNAIATVMGLSGILVPALLIEHYTTYAAPGVTFFGVVLAAFTGVMFGSWVTANSEQQECSCTDQMPRESDEDDCHEAPEGWACIREGGHEGPCAAVEVERI